MANYGVHLDIKTSRYRLGKDDGIRVRIEAYDPCDMEAEIFAYRLLPLNPTTGQYAGHFSHVCSPVDMEEFPIAEPGPTDSPPWFRLDYVDIFVRSTAEAAKFIASVELNVRRLTATLERMDTLVPHHTTRIGGDCSEPEEPDSASDSSDAEDSLGDLYSLTAVATFYQQIGPGVEWEAVGDGLDTVGDSEPTPESYLQVALADGAPSRHLLLQGCDFSELPEDAVIAGVSVELLLRGHPDTLSTDSSALGDCELEPIIATGQLCPRVLYVGLHAPGQGRSDNRADQDCLLDATFEAQTFGGEDDLWGLENLTTAQIRTGDFGTLLVLGTILPAAEVLAAVESALITVHYYV